MYEAFIAPEIGPEVLCHCNEIPVTPVVNPEADKVAVPETHTFATDETAVPATGAPVQAGAGRMFIT